MSNMRIEPFLAWSEDMQDLHGENLKGYVVSYGLYNALVASGIGREGNMTTVPVTRCVCSW